MLCPQLQQGELLLVAGIGAEIGGEQTAQLPGQLVDALLKRFCLRCDVVPAPEQLQIPFPVGPDPGELLLEGTVVGDVAGDEGGDLLLQRIDPGGVLPEPFPVGFGHGIPGGGGRAQLPGDVLLQLQGKAHRDEQNTQSQGDDAGHQILQHHPADAQDHQDQAQDHGQDHAFGGLRRRLGADLLLQCGGDPQILLPEGADPVQQLLIGIQLPFSGHAAAEEDLQLSQPEPVCFRQGQAMQPVLGSGALPEAAPAAAVEVFLRDTRGEETLQLVQIGQFLFRQSCAAQLGFLLRQLPVQLPQIRKEVGFREPGGKTVRKGIDRRLGLLLRLGPGLGGQGGEPAQDMLDAPQLLGGGKAPGPAQEEVGLLLLQLIFAVFHGSQLLFGGFLRLVLGALPDLGLDGLPGAGFDRPQLLDFLQPVQDLLQLGPLALGLIDLLLQLGDPGGGLGGGAALAPVGQVAGALLPQGLYGLVEVIDVVGVVDQIPQLALDAVGGGGGAVVDLGHVGAAGEGLGIQAEQLHADVGGVIAAALVGPRIGQLEGVPLGGGAEAAVDPVALAAVLEDQVAAEGAAVPGCVFFPEILVQGLGRPGEAVEHGPDELRQGGLAEAVVLQNNGESLPEVQAVLGKTAEIFNVAADQLHRATSSPLRAWSPARRTASRSSSGSPAARTSRVNSPLRETSFS